MRYHVSGTPEALLFGPLWSRRLERSSGAVAAAGRFDWAASRSDQPANNSRL